MLPDPDYPSNFLRGIPNKSPQFFDSREQVTGNIFRPHDDQNPENGFYEISINWEDDDAVESFTLRELKDDGSYRYKGGVARVSLERINQMQQEPAWNGAVDYNRDPIEGNNYHGNLFLDENKLQNKNNKKALMARLQLTILHVVPPIE
jgi:hypothetical protein